MSRFTRFLFWILSMVIVGACGLWIMGGKGGEFSTTLTIDANPETVFPFLTDPDQIMVWSEGVSRVEKMEPNVDEHGYSKRITTERVVSRDGREIQFSDEVLRFDQNKKLTVRSTHSNVVITSIFGLESAGEKTAVTYRVKTRNSGLGRFTAPFHKPTHQIRIENEIERLKTSIESRPNAAPGP